MNNEHICFTYTKKKCHLGEKQTLGCGTFILANCQLKFLFEQNFQPKSINKNIFNQ